MRPPDEFHTIVTALLKRFCGQVSHQVPASQLSRFATQLAELIDDRGLPRGLGADELGAPGGMSEEECAPLVARVTAGLGDRVLADAARQLVKACFYPEFKVCRDSFREVTRDGVCRRQQLERARTRISGSHCVDCPHWVGLTPDAHVTYLKQEWCGDPAEFAARQSIFLPEDFRALRSWLYRAARQTGPTQKDSSAQ
jgi:hypothetical protein